MDRKTYEVASMPSEVVIGRQTETGVMAIRIDCTGWLTFWPGLALSIWVVPPGGEAAYLANTHMEGNVLVWDVGNVDTATPGQGTMEIVGTASGKRKLSATVATQVLATSTTKSTDPPAKGQSFLDQMAEATSAANTATSAAKTATQQATAAANRANAAAAVVDENVAAVEADIKAKGAAQVAEVNAAGAAQVAAIEAKGEETRKSIPESWTQLDADVKSLKDTIYDIPYNRSVTLESGIIQPNGGNYSSQGIYVRTKNYISTGEQTLLAALGLADYKWCCWSYSSDTYTSMTHSSGWTDGTKPILVSHHVHNGKPDKNMRLCFRRVDEAELTTDLTDPTSDWSIITAALKFYKHVTVDPDNLMAQMDSTIDSLKDTIDLSFEVGTLNFNTGKNYDSEKRLRTNYYMPSNITSLSMLNGRLAVYVYDSNESPLGYWLNTSLSAEKADPTFSKWIDISMIRRVFPNCKLRVVLSKDDDSVIDDVLFGNNCRASYESAIPTSAEFSAENGLGGWEVGTLNVSTGKDYASAKRIRSIPITLEDGIKIFSKNLVFAVYVYHNVYNAEGDVFDGIWDKEASSLTKGSIRYNQYVDADEIKAALADDSYVRYIRIVAREIDESYDIDVSLCKQVYVQFSDELPGWKSGTLSYKSGHTLNWSLRIRTQNFVDRFMKSAESDTLDLACYVYDKRRTFIGHWKNSTERLSTTSSVEFTKAIDFARIRSLLFADYPDCQFKLVAKYPDGSAILPSAGDSVDFSYGTQTADAKKEISILFVGNSFTQDENAYVPALLKEALPNLNFKIGILFHANGSLQNQYEHMVNQTPYTRFSVYTSDSSAWSNQDSVLLETALARFDWDIVVFQQAQSAGTTYESCQPYLNDLIDGYTNMIGHNVRFMWQLPHARVSYDGKTHEELFAAMAAQAQEVLEKTVVCGFFPSGTAIENARTTTLDELGEKAHLVYDDTAHLQEGLPCLTAAYANVLVIAELIGESRIGVMGSQIMPDQSWVNAQTPPNQHGTSVGATEANRLLAAKCAIMAYKNPYAITDCSGFNPAVS